MPVFVHVSIAAAYALAALVVGALVMRLSDAPFGTAFMIAGVLALGCGQAHALWARRAEVKELSAKLAGARREVRALADQLAVTSERLEAVEAKVEDGTAGLAAEFAQEMRTLETLVRRLEPSAAAPSAPVAAGAGASTVMPRAGAGNLLAIVRDALEEGRVDLHLQPIVALPQRRTVSYEGFARLRDEGGRIIMPGEWMAVAEPAGLVSAIDNLILFRCIQIVRKLAERDRRIAIYCNIAPASLGDEEFFPELLELVRGAGDLAGSLVFELGKEAFERRTPVQARNMARLADFGFRFSLDKVDTLDLEFAELKRANVKTVKIPGQVLADRLGAGGALGIWAAPDIRARDYTALLARYGIDLIAEKIETEATVIEILEFDVAFGQGHLFGPPRPIRDELTGAEPAAPKLRRAG